MVRDTANNRFIIKTDHFSPSGPTAGGGVPSAPSNLSATAQSSSSIALSWTDNSNNETGFKIYRGGSLIYTTSANATSYGSLRIERLEKNPPHQILVGVLILDSSKEIKSENAV